MTLEILPLTPERLPDLAALFNQGGDPKWCWCAYYRLRGVDFSSGSARRNRRVLEGAVDVDGSRGPQPGPRRLPGRRGGRLGQRRPARRLRAAPALEGPRAGRRQAGLVDRLLRRGALGSRRGDRGGAARRGRRLRTRARRDAAGGLSDRDRWRARGVRQRLQGHARDVRASRIRGRRAPASECRVGRRGRSFGGPSGAAVSGARRPRSTSYGPARMPPLRRGPHRHRWRPRSFPGGRRG